MLVKSQCFMPVLRSKNDPVDCACMIIESVTWLDDEAKDSGTSVVLKGFNVKLITECLFMKTPGEAFLMDFTVCGIFTLVYNLTNALQRNNKVIMLSNLNVFDLLKT